MKDPVIFLLSSLLFLGCLARIAIGESIFKSPEKEVSNSKLSDVLLSPKKAVQFLSTRVRRGLGSSYEECCSESGGCTREEINEYSYANSRVIKYLREISYCRYWYCDSGYSISSWQRCNLRIDCGSNCEDEKDCSFPKSKNLKIEYADSHLLGNNKAVIIRYGQSKIPLRLSNQKTAKVVCKSLGFRSALVIYSTRSRKIRGNDKTYISIKCEGSERDFTRCKYDLKASKNDWMSFTEIKCYDKHSLSLRKGYGESKWYRRFGAVYLSGRPICYNSWKAWGENEANAICREFSRFYIGKPFNATALVNDTWLSATVTDLECDRSSQRFSECKANRGGYCHSKAGVVCISGYYSFSLKNGERGLLEAIDIPIIATKPIQWTFNNTKVICDKETGIPYGKHEQILVEDQNNTTCLVRDVECEGYEDSLAECSFGITPYECPETFYQISIDCISCRANDFTYIIREVNTTGTRQEQYNSILNVLENLKARCGDWSCYTHDYFANEHLHAYCVTWSALQRLKYLLKPRPNKFVYLNTEYDSTSMVREKRWEERFSELHEAILKLSTSITKSQLQVSKRFQEIATFKTEKIKTKVNEFLVPRERQLALLFDSQTYHLLREQLVKLKNEATIVKEKELAEATIDTILSFVSALFQIGEDWFEQLISLAKDGVSQIHQAKTESKRVAYLVGETKKLSPIIERFRQHFEKNKVDLKAARRFLLVIKVDKERFDSHAAAEFLDRYGGVGEIAIEPNEFSLLGDILSNVVEGLCGVIIESRSILATDAIQSEAQDGLCAETRKTMNSVLTIIQEINSNEATMAQALEDLAQAKLEESSAYELSKSLENNIQSDLELKLKQMLSIFIIKVQKRNLIEEACDKITYLNHGHEKDFCTQIKQNIDDVNIDRLIAFYQRDMCLNPTFASALIPITSKQRKDGTIDLSQLLQKSNDTLWKTSGEVLLKIPNDHKWLSDHGWIQEEDTGPFFIKQFEIFMPPQHPSKGGPYRVETKIEMIKNTLNKVQYMFDEPMSFGVDYEDNVGFLSCRGHRYSPYQTCSTDQTYSVCITKSGTLPGPYYPSADSTWKISVRSKYELPNVYSSTPFHLQAKLQICSTQPKKVNRRQRDRSSSRPGCCTNKQYSDVKERIKASGNNPCKPCPAGMSRLGGYFCENCPPGMKPSPDVYGCQSCPPGTQNQKSDSSKCL
ncbi:uncharacterized protein [Clytia hemisphaerica]|uniref:SRCR domain-containing protein n=1 Tax=Clytia hemisphaerica TaxID=252671 RepID=A0A7M5WVW3_9CNID|eukprot:TCONS_00060553-protein